ncbi:NAD(P)-binding protein [Pluteus cervinus]|uniref:NAD(P)-binding protein n=1 Tax=Pluteus cervinus TaxID=181527 RepID=A0ACD3AQN3_9AGAR|nr:NAD(P)-binding protein [Pluteus cervinus]
MPPRRVWFITGASSGFGFQLTKLVLTKGDVAVATARHLEPLNDLFLEYGHTNRLLVLKLDVTVEGDIRKVFEEVRKTYRRIDVVYNNAGLGGVGEVENTPNDFARETFETNFWGAAHVTRAAVKFFREVNSPRGGRLIQASSMYGFAAGRGGYYSASKFALEGLTEAVAQEINPEWNIKITLVEAGHFKTNISRHRGRIPAHPAYNHLAKRPSVADPVVNVGDPVKLCEALYGLAGLGNPPLRLVLGNDALELVKGKLAKVREEVDQYETWSADLKPE